MLLYDRVANTANFAKGRIESLYNYGIDSANTVIGSGRDVVAKWVRIVVGTGVIFGLLALAVITSIISFLCDYVFTHWVDLDDVTGLIKIPLFFYKLSTTIVARVMKIEWNMGATIEQTSSYVRTAVGDAFTSVKQLDFKKMNLEEVTMSGIDTSNQHLNDQLTVLKDKGTVVLTGSNLNGFVTYIEEIKDRFDETENLFDVQEEVIDGFYEGLDQVKAQWKSFRGESKQK